jgi:hypothetical protein
VSFDGILIVGPLHRRISAEKCARQCPTDNHAFVTFADVTGATHKNGRGDGVGPVVLDTHLEGKNPLTKITSTLVRSGWTEVQL